MFLEADWALKKRSERKKKHDEPLRSWQGENQRKKNVPHQSEKKGNLKDDGMHEPCCGCGSEGHCVGACEKAKSEMAKHYA